MIRIDVSDITTHLDLDLELTEKVVEDTQNETGLKLLRGLQAATPVDTGAARNSWQLTTGTDTVVESTIPYMGRLNDGWSQQAPAGFIEAVVDGLTRK